MMKPPAASPGRAEKPQLAAPAPPGLARLLLSKSKSRRGGGRSRRAPATSPMFVSRGRSRAAGAEGEPSSPKVTCIGQVRMRNKGKKKAVAAPKAPDKAKKGYCRCLKKAFLCGGLFEFDRRRRPKASPPPPPSEVVERTRRSPWVFSSRDVAVAAAPKPVDARSGKAEVDDEMEVGVGVFGSSVRRHEAEAELGINGAQEHESEPQQLVSSATTTPPKNALLLMRCRSAPQNSSSPLTSRFPVAALTRDAPAASAACLSPPPRNKLDDKAASPSPAPRRGADNRFSPAPSPSPRRKSEKVLADGDGEQGLGTLAVLEQAQDQAEEGDQEADDDEEFEGEDEVTRCSSARPLVLQRCKSEPATTAAAKMAAGAPAADATTAGCFWANGGSSGRRRHAPVALTGH